MEPRRILKTFAILVLSLIAVSILSSNSTPIISTSAVPGPGCGSTITVSMNLTANIGPCPDTALYIGNSNIILDCAGHTISGEAGASGQTYSNVGISLLTVSGVKVSGVKVENCVIEGFSSAPSSPNSLIGVGVYAYYSYGDTFLGNIFRSSEDAFWLRNSTYNILRGNVAYNSLFLVDSSSDNNSVVNNTAYGNGFEISYSSGNVLTSNTVTNSTSGGFLILSSSDNMLSTNNADSDGGYGFDLFLSSDNNTFVYNRASNNIVGFEFDSSSDNNLSINSANNNGLYGFEIDNASSSNKLFGDTADHNNQYGFYDLSKGSGTEGTANLYSHNSCFSDGEGGSYGGSSPDGLCALTPPGLNVTDFTSTPAGTRSFTPTTSQLELAGVSSTFLVIIIVVTILLLSNRRKKSIGKQN